jgi:ribosomal protein S13
MKKWLFAAGGAALLVVLVGVLTVATVAAQTPTPPTNRQSLVSDFLGKVARNLGIDQSRLEAAIKQAALQTIDEQQAAGKLTPEQAQRLRDRINSGQGLGHFGPPLGAGLKGPRGFQPFQGLDEAARILGLTTDQLRQELRSGKSLAEIAAARNISRDTLVNGLTTAATQRIDAAVSAGRLTQQQATALKQRLPDQINRLVDAKRPPR